MSVKLDDTIYLHFGTASASTGAATDADSTPTCTVEEDGVALGYGPTVTNVATGLYRITIVCTTGNGFEAGKRYSIFVVATVGGVTGRDGVAEFEVVTRSTDDLAFPATSGRSLSVESDGMVYADLREWLGTAPLALASQRVQVLTDAITAGIVNATAAPNLDAAVSTRALEAGGNLATVLARIIGTLAAGTHVAQTGDSFARIGATGSGLTTLAAAADLATLLARVVGTIAAGTHSPQSGDAFARIGAAGAALTALGDARIANLDAAVSSRGTADPGDAMTLTAGERTAISNAVGERTADGAISWDEAQILLLAFVAGKTDGGGTTTVHFYRQDGTTAAITMTVDANGNRSMVVVDVA